MKFGEVYRRREDGVTVLVIGRLARAHVVDEGNQREAQPGETVLMTLDQGAYGQHGDGDPTRYWLAGKTGWDTDGGINLQDWDLVGELE